MTMNKKLEQLINVIKWLLIIYLGIIPVIMLILCITGFLTGFLTGYSEPTPY